MRESLIPDIVITVHEVKKNSEIEHKQIILDWKKSNIFIEGEIKRFCTDSDQALHYIIW